MPSPFDTRPIQHHAEALAFAKAAIESCNAAPDWAATWVALRMEFFRRFQHPYVFSTRFGAKFFEEIVRRIERDELLKPDPGTSLAEWDRNFNEWLRKSVCKPETLAKYGLQRGGVPIAQRDTIV